MVDTGQLKAPSNWRPEQNLVRLALYSKKSEEDREVGLCLDRCIMQGIDEINPTTGKTNREELEQELADQQAMSVLMAEELGLNVSIDRLREKYDHKKAWLDMLRGE